MTVNEYVPVEYFSENTLGKIKLKRKSGNEVMIEHGSTRQWLTTLK